jgi:hypothetical protein
MHYYAKLLFVRAMVERTQVDLVVGDEYDRTPLHMAAENGNLPVVQCTVSIALSGHLFMNV